jgi:hypothetical protein
VFENTVLRRIFGPHRDEMTAGLGKLGAEVVQLLQSLYGLDYRGVIPGRSKGIFL